MNELTDDQIAEQLAEKMGWEYPTNQPLKQPSYWYLNGEKVWMVNGPLNLSWAFIGKVVEWMEINGKHLLIDYMPLDKEFHRCVFFITDEHRVKWMFGEESVKIRQDCLFKIGNITPRHIALAALVALQNLSGEAA